MESKLYRSHPTLIHHLSDAIIKRLVQEYYNQIRYIFSHGYVEG
jgi:hypothetical protein